MGLTRLNKTVSYSWKLLFALRLADFVTGLLFFNLFFKLLFVTQDAKEKFILSSDLINARNQADWETYAIGVGLRREKKDVSSAAWGRESSGTGLYVLKRK